MKLLDTLGKTKKAIGGVICILIIGMIIFLLGMHFGGRKSEPIISSTALTQQLKEANDLITLEYNYTKVGKFENSLQLNGWNIPLTNKSFLLAYSGKLSAGVDLTNVNITINKAIIHVEIPDITIMSNVIDESSIEVYDETKNIFNPISIEDYTEFAKQQKTRVEDEAIENGFLSEAATKAQASIRKFLEMIPDIKDKYQIEVNFRKE